MAVTKPVAASVDKERETPCIKTSVDPASDDAPLRRNSGATIDALDLGGNVIVGQPVTIPGASVNTSNQVLTFTGAIHSLRFTHTASTVGTLPIDDLTIGNLTASPEPSTFVLLGAGLLLLSATRKKH